MSMIENESSCNEISAIHDYFLPFLTNTSYVLQMRAIVKEVAKVFPTAIISGRSQEKVKLGDEK